MDPKLIWIASFPRSGNTLLRRILHSVTGWPTYSLYPDLNIADQQREEIGHIEVPKMWQDAARVPSLDPGHPRFVKNHEWPAPGDSRPAVLVVRDGRDVLCSFARYLKTKESSKYVKMSPEGVLDRLIDGKGPHGSWSQHVKKWLEHPQKTVLYYHNLAELANKYQSATVGVVTTLLDLCGVASDTIDEQASLPAFEELHAADPDFYHRGGSYWNEVMTPEQHDLFWKKHGYAMDALGYRR